MFPKAKPYVLAGPLQGSTSMHHPRFIKLRFGILLSLLLLAVASAHGQNPVPFISQPLFPSAMAPGGPSFILTVNGTNFISTTMAGYTTNSVVYWNGAALTTTFVNNHQLKALVPAVNIASQGTVWVTVSNGGVTSNVAYFEVTSSAFVSFSSTSYGLSTVSDSIAVGDLNGDGRLDLVSANNTLGTVSVLLGNGEGTFQPAVNYAVSSEITSVVIADFNGDGKQDLAVGEYGDFVYVLLGNGDGTFQTPKKFAVGKTPWAIAVGDFNGDGKLDLAVANNLSNTISVLLGNGDGTFQSAVNYAVGSQPSSVAAGDFNGDGTLDLAVTNFMDGNVSLLFGNGDGTFQPAVNFAVGSYPDSVATGDFNGDGALDLVVANNGSNNVIVLLGHGDGTFFHRSTVRWALILSQLPLAISTVTAPWI